MALPDGRFLLCGKSIDGHARCPVNSKLVRAEVLAGFLVTPDASDPAGACTLVYLARADLKGNIPAFVTKQVAKDTPMTVAAVRKVAAQRLQQRDFPSLQNALAPPLARASDVPLSFRNRQVVDPVAVTVQPAAIATPATPAVGAPTPATPAVASSPPAAADAAPWAEALASVTASLHPPGPGGSAAGAGAPPPLLLDPCMFNTPQVRRACIPAANGHFSARALAVFYAHLLPGAPGGALITDDRRDDMCRVRAGHGWPPRGPEGRAALTTSGVGRAGAV